MVSTCVAEATCRVDVRDCVADALRVAKEKGGRLCHAGSCGVIYF